MGNIYLCGQTALLVWQRLRCMGRPPRLDRVEALADRLEQLQMTGARVRRAATDGDNDEQVAHRSYGLPLPTMNGPVEVPEKARELVGRAHFLCDAYWPDARFALEYDGANYHATAEQVSRDRRRADQLEMLGIGVARIDGQVLFDATRFGKTARGVARRIGYRLPTCTFDTA